MTEPRKHLHSRTRPRPVVEPSIACASAKAPHLRELLQHWLIGWTASPSPVACEVQP
jgi:hypothetical protein